MAIDAYMFFFDYNKKYLQSESQVELTAKTNPEALASDFVTANSNGGLFEIDDFNFDIEQTLNIGSGGSGAGAGKITFNPFSVTRKIDKSSPVLFQAACAGTPYANVGLGLRKSSGTSASGSFFLEFSFKLVAVKTISWSNDDESPKEEVAFEYGALVIQYTQQKQDGTFLPAVPGGWNKVNNKALQDPAATIGGSSS
jgi:type VI secretion system secreted protein Hcp